MHYVGMIVMKIITNIIMYTLSVCEEIVCLENIAIPNVKLPGNYIIHEANLLASGVCDECR